MERTTSPFWREPSVTRLIRAARDQRESRDQLAELVYRPAFRRLDDWFRKSGIRQLNIEVDEVFSDLWTRDITKAIGAVDFQNREHFLRLVILRCRQAARRYARRERSRRPQASALGEADPSFAPAESDSVEFGESLDQALRAITRLDQPGRAVVELYFFEGLTIRQIADELRLPTSSTHHTLKTSLHQLKEWLS